MSSLEILLLRRLFKTEINASSVWRKILSNSIYSGGFCCNTSEWKKNLRIDYVCKLIEEGNAKNITIEAISTNAGFVSRSKFIDAFKERKGVTPSAFIKSQPNN